MLEPIRTPEMTFCAAGQSDADSSLADLGDGKVPIGPRISRAKEIGLACVPLLALGFAPYLLLRPCGDAVRHGVGLVLLL